jgi:hypothetical protein
MFKTINVTTHENTYDTPLGDQNKGKVVDNPSSYTPPPSSNPLQIEKFISDVVLHPPKSIIRKETFNLNAHSAQNYNIFEYLAQVPCTMSALKVLQHYPSQHRTLLSEIGAMDPKDSNLIAFNLDYFKERVSHHLAFQIQILVGGIKIHHTILDEGASTCFMSFPPWRSLGSPTLTQSPTTLKVFDGCGFQPHRILQSFVVALKGKTVSIDIEVVDMPLDYNLLLGRSWLYAMNFIAYSVFRIL